MPAGEYIGRSTPGDKVEGTSTGAASPEDCCSKCQAFDNCAFSRYIVGANNVDKGTCNIFRWKDDAEHSGAEQAGTYDVSSYGDNSVYAYFSNGPAGNIQPVEA